MSAVNAASRAVTTRSSIPSLEGVLVEVGGAAVSFTGYNLSTGVKAVVPAECGEQGAVVLNARLFGEIVRRSPDDMVTISSDDKFMVTITCGQSEFTIMGLSPGDFPALPETESDMTLNMAQGTLKSMINMTIFAVSDNENKPVHTGALFDIKDGFLNVVAVDGFRMAIRKEEVSASVDSFKFVVPSAALREVERICSDGEDAIIISLGRRHITFDMGDVILISRLLEGEFLNYETTLPKNFEFSLIVESKAFQNAVERVSLIISERLKNPVRCVFSGSTVRLWCQTALGRANDEIPVKGTCGEMEIGFNNRYIHDAIKAVPDDEFVLDITNNLSPCIFRPVDGDKYLFMVLPVRLKS